MFTVYCVSIDWVSDWLTTLVVHIEYAGMSEQIMF